jgi:hypothetical protein
MTQFILQYCTPPPLQETFRNFNKAATNFKIFSWSKFLCLRKITEHNNDLKNIALFPNSLYMDNEAQCEI